jgi:hypothetical protein
MMRIKTIEIINKECYNKFLRLGGVMAAARHSKCRGSNPVWVQVPPQAHKINSLRGNLFLFIHIFPSCVTFSVILSPYHSGGMKQLEKQKQSEPLPESYLLCRECDGSWVDSRHGKCTCGQHTTSRDFELCLSCALTKHQCQHCGEHMQVRISVC